MEFQRLKKKEKVQIEWTAKRELSKINYHIHTDAIKKNLVPEQVTTAQASIIYAEEADVLNVAMFGVQKKEHPKCGVLLCHAHCECIILCAFFS